MLNLHRFIDEHTARFIGLPETLEAIRPSSEAARRRILSLDAFTPEDRDALAAHHARLRVTMNLIEQRPELADHLRHHLRHLPWLGDVWEQQWGQAELALLSAFAYHHGRIRERLTAAPELADWLSLVDNATLDDGTLGDRNSSGFRLSDARDPELSELREQVRTTSKAARAEERRLRELIAADYGVSQDARQWVVDRTDSARLERMLNDDRLMVAHDAISSVRFAAGPSEILLDLRRDLDELLARERSTESRLYFEIEQVLRGREDSWLSQQSALVGLDLLLTQAQLAIDWQAVAPEIVADSAGLTVDVAGGVHRGIEDWVVDNGGAYTPLTVEISEKVATLSGANMGGKTVVLQTFGWLQTMAQLGFFVPAETMRTRLYRRIAALSSYRETLGGLSGFGREVARLSAIMPWRAQGVMYLIDEPGRTTHVEDGRAIARAVMEAIMQSPSRALVATHLDRLAGPGVGRLRMGGLIRQRLDDFRNASKTALPPLHTLMSYRIEREDPTAVHESDALDVAELLGLEETLVARAREVLNNGQ